jgi:DNA modification methylase
MQDTYGFSYADLMVKGYGSRASISNKVRLLDLSKEVQDKIIAGKLTETHGLNLAKLPSHDEQSRMAQRFCEKDISANRSKFHVNNYLEKLKASSKPGTAIPASTGELPNVYFKDSSDMGEITDEGVHLIVTSPPYHVGMEFEQNITFADHMENIKAVLAECARVLVPGGIMALNVADIHNFKQNIGQTPQKAWKLMGHLYQEELQNHNILLEDMIMWKKNTPWRSAPRQAYDENLVHTQYLFHNNFEPIYIFKKTGSRTTPGEPINSQSALTKQEWVNWIASTWEISNTRKESKHPCEWPDELPRRLIRMFSFIGDTVLDPWLGSGTTVKVAEELGRQGIGYERYEKYFSMIKERLGKSTKALDEKKAFAEKPLSSLDDTHSPLTLEELGKECEKGIVELDEPSLSEDCLSAAMTHGSDAVIAYKPTMTLDQTSGEAVALA